MTAVTSHRPARIVKNYGRGSFLAILSPIIAFFMASRGMNGWEQYAEREMDKDSREMFRRGYHLVSAEEHTLPLLGIMYITATYELVQPAP